MGKHMDTFEVEVQLDSLNYVPLLGIEAVFSMSEDGPVNLTLEAITEIPVKGREAQMLIFTQHEIAAIRFAVADAIERKYWAGEYSEIRTA